MQYFRPAVGVAQRLPASRTKWSCTFKSVQDFAQADPAVLGFCDGVVTRPGRPAPNLKQASPTTDEISRPLDLVSVADQRRRYCKAPDCQRSTSQILGWAAVPASLPIIARGSLSHGTECQARRLRPQIELRMVRTASSRPQCALFAVRCTQRRARGFSRCCSACGRGFGPRRSTTAHPCSTSLWSL